MITVILTSARIPLAMVLGQVLGLEGIWWAFSLSSIVKGVVFFLYYLGELKGLERSP